MFKEQLLFNNSMHLYAVMYTFWLDKFRQLVPMHKEKYPSKNIMIHSVQTRANEFDRLKIVIHENAFFKLHTFIKKC